jgi:hypothetical protein
MAKETASLEFLINMEVIIKLFFKTISCTKFRLIIVMELFIGNKNIKMGRIKGNILNIIKMERLKWKDKEIFIILLDPLWLLNVMDIILVILKMEIFKVKKIISLGNLMGNKFTTLKMERLDKKKILIMKKKMGSKLFIIKMETFNKNIQRNTRRMKYQL